MATAQGLNPDFDPSLGPHSPPWLNHAFVHPAGHNRAQLEPLVQQAVDHILAYLTSAAAASPLPPVTQVPGPPLPAEPTDLEDLLTDLQTIMAQSMNPAHPGYLGHMDPLPTLASVLGDWVAAALNNNMLSVEMSPILSRLEVGTMGALAQLFGLGERAGGVLASGGTLANLQALTVARNHCLGVMDTGLAGLAQRPVIVASALAHSSIRKAAMVLGLGTAGLVSIPADAQGKLDLPALEDYLHQAPALGQRPFALVATAGTTVTGNIDPLPALSDIAQGHGLWFHVDAAYGGAMMFSARHRPRLAGIERADSVTFNPQKWLYVTKTCATVMFRDMGLLNRQFRVSAPYMDSDTDLPNLGEISLQGTRPADILKLWLSLRHLGQRQYGELVDASYALTAHFVAEVQQRPYLELATPPEMNLVCFRGCLPALDVAAQDAWNARLRDHLLAQKLGFFSLPQLGGRGWLKAVLLNPYTTPQHITALFAAVDAFAAGA